MNVITFKPQISREYILSRVSEEEIFEMYGIPVVDYSFNSPLRKDRHPTCRFYRRRRDNRLVLRDFGGHFWGDCFDLVQLVTKKNFFHALNDIAVRFKLIEGTTNSLNLDRIPAAPVVVIKPVECEIRVKRMPWTDEHLNYWKQYGVSLKTLELYQVAPIEYAWLNGEAIFWYGKRKEIAFCYYFGGYDYKLYFPTRQRGEMRFIHNDANILQGYLQLPATAEAIVITKSLKDVMALREFEVYSCAPMSETQVVSKVTDEELSSRFEKKFSLYDLDRPGITSMKAMRKMGYQPLFFSRNQPKDFTDFIKVKGYSVAEALVEHVKSIYL